MFKTEQNGEEFEYELRDISNYASNDPKGIVPDNKPVMLTEKIASEINYARALNGNPYRLIKVD